MTVEGRDGQSISALFQRGQLSWTQQNPFGQQPEEWRLLPMWESEKVSENEILAMPSGIVALAGMDDPLWSKGKILRVLQQLDPNQDINITMASCHNCSVMKVGKTMKLNNIRPWYSV